MQKKSGSGIAEAADETFEFAFVEMSANIGRMAAAGLQKRSSGKLRAFRVVKGYRACSFPAHVSDHRIGDLGVFRGLRKRTRGG